jgi:ornithine cyclodeaminase/alanine dehydrogenase-like protein (mu-crystallin family)
MTLLLTRREATSLLDLPQAMAVTRDVLREQAAGAAVAIPPRHVRMVRGALRIVSGALLESRRAGVRTGPAVALAGKPHTALLYDAESGDLLCIMGYPFATLRTGATVGVATDLLARADARQIGMIGTGRNALSLLEAACHVRPVERIRVYSRNAERRTAFAEQAQAALGVPVEPAADAPGAVRDAAIVYVATDSLTPALHADWLAPGAFVASMGRPSEVDPSVYLAAARVVVGHRKHEEEYFDVGQYQHHLLELVKSGQIAWDNVLELCDVAVGKAPGRTAPDEIVVFKESQGGFGDIAFADWAYARAVERGIGQHWDG